MNRSLISATQALKATRQLSAGRRYATTVAPTTNAAVAPNTSEAYLDMAKVPIASVEVSFNNWTKNQQSAIIDRLAELQKKNWKELSLEEKRAAYFVAFGPHSARTPRTLPGDNLKIFFGVVASVGASIALFAFMRSFAGEPPRTMNPEWQEATNEYLREQKANPITGISSEGYKGKGMVNTD
ncbi:cytochrome c oxidase, partial [Tieghemiomyces parasiticus]